MKSATNARGDNTEELRPKKPAKIIPAPSTITPAPTGVTQTFADPTSASAINAAAIKAAPTTAETRVKLARLWVGPGGVGGGGGVGGAGGIGEEKRCVGASASG